MGVEPSKVVVDDLASSYCHAINSGQDHIQVQPNEKFLHALKELWSKASDDIKSAIEEPNHPPRKKRRTGPESSHTQAPRGETGPLLEQTLVNQNSPPASVDQTVFSDAFFKQLPSWENDPLSFFQQHGLVFSEKPLADIRELMVRLEDGEELNQIRLRFLAVLHYRLKKDFICKDHLESSDIQLLNMLMSRSGAPNQPQILKGVKEWIRLGSQIETICCGIGQGSLDVEDGHLSNVFFMELVSDRSLSRMGFNTEPMKDAIKNVRSYREGCKEKICLKRLGRLASQIIDKLWSHVTSSLPVRWGDMILHPVTEAREAGTIPAVFNSVRDDGNILSSEFSAHGMNPSACQDSNHLAGSVQDPSQFQYQGWDSLAGISISEGFDCQQWDFISGIITPSPNSFPWIDYGGTSGNLGSEVLPNDLDLDPTQAQGASTCDFQDFIYPTGASEDPTQVDYQTYDSCTGVSENLDCQRWHAATGVAEVPLTASHNSHTVLDPPRRPAQTPLTNTEQTLSDVAQRDPQIPDHVHSNLIRQAFLDDTSMSPSCGSSGAGGIDFTLQQCLV